MEVDALGNQIVIGEFYGYSRSQNGTTLVITGRAKASAKGKVTLTEIEEKNFYSIGNGVQQPNRVDTPDRARTVGSVQLFHTPMHALNRKQPEHDCMQNAVPDGMLYKCSICKHIL